MKRERKDQEVRSFLHQLFSVIWASMLLQSPSGFPPILWGWVGLGHRTHGPSTPGILWNPTLGMGRDRSQKTSKVVERYPQAWHLRQLFNWPTNRSRQKQRDRRKSHCWLSEMLSWIPISSCPWPEPPFPATNTPDELFIPFLHFHHPVLFPHPWMVSMFSPKSAWPTH